MKTTVITFDTESLDAAMQAGGMPAYDQAIRDAITPISDFVCEEPCWTELHGGLVWMMRELTVNARSAAHRNSQGAHPLLKPEFSVLANTFEETGDFEILIRNRGLPGSASQAG